MKKINTALLELLILAGQLRNDPDITMPEVAIIKLEDLINKAMKMDTVGKKIVASEVIELLLKEYGIKYDGSEGDK